MIVVPKFFREAPKLGICSAFWGEVGKK